MKVTVLLALTVQTEDTHVSINDVAETVKCVLGHIDTQPIAFTEFDCEIEVTKAEVKGILIP